MMISAAVRLAMKRIRSGVPLARIDVIVIEDHTAAQDQIDVALHLISESGREVLTARDTLANGSVFSFGRQIQLKDIPPGRYLLRLDAQARGVAAKPAATETAITVLPAI